MLLIREPLRGFIKSVCNYRINHIVLIDDASHEYSGLAIRVQDLLIFSEGGVLVMVQVKEDAIARFRKDLIRITFDKIDTVCHTYG